VEDPVDGVIVAWVKIIEPDVDIMVPSGAMVKLLARIVLLTAKELPVLITMTEPGFTVMEPTTITDVFAGTTNWEPVTFKYGRKTVPDCTVQEPPTQIVPGPGHGGEQPAAERHEIDPLEENDRAHRHVFRQPNPPSSHCSPAPTATMLSPH
jgi:hypothetical protein